ncbi:hypothetical protein [Actinophytocola sp. NPDC049390]|uniref:hypothetical protein n=1 Tax=Actinophytocola sp. NPDC049390 TaxID=3363894 RepID=UPI0037892534
MADKVRVPVAVAGVVVAVGAVLGGIFVFAGDETGRGGGPAAGPAPTTRLSLPYSSGTKPVPDDPYPRVPSAQVDGPLPGESRTAGRSLYIPVHDDECFQDQVWHRGEDANRVEVEIRSTPGPRIAVTTFANGDSGYGGYCGPGPDYAVIELAEPLGDRRLVVNVFILDPPPSR